MLAMIPWNTVRLTLQVGTYLGSPTGLLRIAVPLLHPLASHGRWSMVTLEEEQGSAYRYS